MKEMRHAVRAMRSQNRSALAHGVVESAADLTSTKRWKYSCAK